MSGSVNVPAFRRFCLLAWPRRGCAQRRTLWYARRVARALQVWWLWQMRTSRGNGLMTGVKRGGARGAVRSTHDGSSPFWNTTSTSPHRLHFHLPLSFGLFLINLFLHRVHRAIASSPPPPHLTTTPSFLVLNPATGQDPPRWARQSPRKSKTARCEP